MCYDMTTRKLIISRDVKFVESESFFQPQDDNKIQSQGECLSNLVPLPTITSDDTCLNNEAQQSLYLSNRSQQIEESTSSAPAATALYLPQIIQSYLHLNSPNANQQGRLVHQKK